MPTVRWRQVGVLISGFGLVGWCVYLWLTFGDPLIWPGPGGVGYRRAARHTWFKLTYFDTVLHGYKLKALSTDRAGGDVRARGRGCCRGSVGSSAGATAPMPSSCWRSR